MNNIILSGRLVRDPDLKYTNSNQAVARFTLAVDKGLSREKKQEMESKNQATADFINCQAWGKMAENVNRFTEKGKRILVQGRIQTGSYQDKDGKTVYTTDVIANNVEFIDWKDTNNAYSSNVGQNVTTSNEFEEDFDPTQDDGRIPF